LWCSGRGGPATKPLHHGRRGRRGWRHPPPHRGALVRHHVCWSPMASGSRSSPSGTTPAVVASPST
jgi:hypothetical protein